MNSTLKLLRTIGSPFASDKEMPENRDESLELYDYATKNKIGLLYLETLKEQGKLSEFGLVPEYDRELKKHNEQLITTIRVSKLLNSIDCNYAIFKSIMPFPAVPNDVDMVHFGSDAEFERIAKVMLQSDYTEVCVGVDSSQREFHDTRVCEHLDLNKKDVYDIDIYQEIAASYIIYLDKNKIREHITKIDVEGNLIKVLNPEAELVAIIIHSIIPEMLCTLLVYYATLHYLARMNLENINRLIDIAWKNNVTFPVKAHYSLVATLHQAAHGFVPEKVEEVLSKLGNETFERKNLLKNDFKTPHRYGESTIIRTLLEKAKENKFRRSAIKQTLNMLLNPKLAKWVIWNVIWRRRRETY